MFTVQHSTDHMTWTNIAVFADTNAFQHFCLSLTHTLGGHFYRTKFN